MARPFDYNFTIGPEYFYFSSNLANVSANLVSCGIICNGNLYERWNLEFRGGVGEISTTKMNFNEISALYNTEYSPSSYFGIGTTLLSYDNIINKATNVSFSLAKLNAKMQWEHSFSPLLGFYGKVVGPTAWGWEAGWLTYFNRDYGDFNIVLGYKDLRLSENISMRGPYIASSVYF